MFIYYGQSKFRSGGFQFRQSERLVWFLNNHAEPVKAESVKEAVIETLTWIVNSYGFILPEWYAPREKIISFSDFAEAIATVYSDENRKTRYAIEFLKELSHCAI